MKRILLIEDNHNLREEIINVLELEGFEVRTAENGRVGLTRIEEEVPDLVLCDLMMPDMDGYETLKAIRCQPRDAHAAGHPADRARRRRVPYEGQRARRERLRHQALQDPRPDPRRTGVAKKAARRERGIA
jgi:CheY-like chemotaxis protein